MRILSAEVRVTGAGWPFQNHDEKGFPLPTGWKFTTMRKYELAEKISGPVEPVPPG